MHSWYAVPMTFRRPKVTNLFELDERPADLPPFEGSLDGEAVFHRLRASLDALASPYDLVLVACPQLRGREYLAASKGSVLTFDTSTLKTVNSED